MRKKKVKLYFASNNEHKKAEMERLIKTVDLILPGEMGLNFNPVENGNSFFENALIKAKSLYSMVKAPVLADDSGLVLDYYTDLLGIHTSRFGKDMNEKITSKEQCLLLLDKMKAVENRAAHFVCNLILYMGPDRFYSIQETVNGNIAQNMKGTDGFGYDPIFIVEKTGKTASELKPEEKDLFSHRGKAARKLLKLIDEEIYGN